MSRRHAKLQARIAQLESEFLDGNGEPLARARAALRADIDSLPWHAFIDRSILKGVLRNMDSSSPVLRKRAITDLWMGDYLTSAERSSLEKVPDRP